MFKKNKIFFKIIFGQESFNFLTIGIIESNFEIAFLKEKNIESESIKDIKKIKRILKNKKADVNTDYILENFFIHASTLSILKSLKAGDTNLLNSHNELYKSILKNFDKKIILVNAISGSGKTSLALKLFYDSSISNKKSFLMLNNFYYYRTELQSHYNTFKLDLDKFATFNTKVLIDYHKKSRQERILIIDEGQRIGQIDVEELVKSSKIIIVFIDEYQKFMNIDSKNDLKQNLIKYVEKEQIYETDLKESFRIDQEIFENIKKVIYNSRKIEKKLPIDFTNKPYKINVYLNHEIFLNKFNNQNTNLSSILVTDYESSFGENINEIAINNNKFSVEKLNEDFIKHCNLDKEYKKKNIGNTKHVYSFDVDHLFVYLPNLILDTQTKVLRNKNSDSSWLRNELYILFTRATKELNILVDDIMSFMYFRKYLDNNKK